jgi:SAM-dependent methyltransferase
MTSGKVTGRLLAPARIAAKRLRHLSMSGRRRWKRVADWRGWEAARTRIAAIEIPRPALEWPVLRLAHEVRSCPACDSTAVRVLEPMPLSSGGGRMPVGFASGCADCGLVFASPMPDQQTLDQFYSPEGHWGQDHQQRNEVLERRAQRALAGYRKENQPRRARHVILDALAPFVRVADPSPEAAALDYGCGDGKLLNGLQEEGWRTFGVEPSSDVAFLRHERVESLPAEPAFDLVVLHHVLEHVPRPLDLLASLVATLRPGGVLFISVPRLDMLPEHGDFRYCVNGRTHLVSFTEDCLRELLRRAGAEPLAALSSPELDAQLSEGRPLRLRMVARRTSADVPPAAQPLRAALRAFAEYRRRRAKESWLERRLPARIRAYRLARDLRIRVSDRASAA